MFENIILKLVSVIFIASCLWAAGFVLQRENRYAKLTDYHFQNKGKWARLLGSRFAFIQIIALLFLVAGLFAVICCNARFLSLVFRLLVVTVGVGGLVTLLLDIFPRKK